MACSAQWHVSRRAASHYQAEDSVWFVISSDLMPGSVLDGLLGSRVLDWRQDGIDDGKFCVNKKEIFVVVSIGNLENYLL